MQVPHFTYDELTPLKQCIVDFMRRQQSKPNEHKQKHDVARQLADA
jgi:hypothetical protein